MRVLLLNPPPVGQPAFVREGRCMNRQSTWECLWPPLTLMYLSSVLRRAGHETRIFDGIVEKGGIAGVKSVAGEFRPDLAILNTSTPTIGGDLKSARLLKARGVKVALVGVHPTGEHLSLVRDPAVDFVIRNEPEETARELAGALSKGKPLSKVAGITYKASGGKVRANAPRPFIADITSLPWPDREEVDNSRYKLPFSGRRFTLINTSRGCPYSCTYCTASVYYGKRFRARDAKSIADEMADAKARYGISDFLFWADEFTFDRKAVVSLCEELIDRKMNAKWFANSRVDSADEGLLKLMRKAGCWMVSFGIESASQEILDNVKKGAKVGRAVEAVRAAKRAGLKTIGHFILGLPGETRETALRTIRFARELDVDYAQFYVATPYVGTPFHDYCARNGLILESDTAKHEINNAVIREGALSRADLTALRNSAFKEFYLRPSYIVKTVAEAAMSPATLLATAVQSATYLTDWGARKVQK